MPYLHSLLIHDIACYYCLESALPKPDYETIPLTSVLSLVFAFLMCVILHSKTSEVTVLRSLFQKATHHRRRHACVAVGVGRIIVNMLVNLEAQLRVVTTAMVVSWYKLVTPTNGEPGNLLHRVLKRAVPWSRH